MKNMPKDTLVAEVLRLNGRLTSSLTKKETELLLYAHNHHRQLRLLISETWNKEGTKKLIMVSEGSL